MLDAVGVRRLESGARHSQLQPRVVLMGWRTPFKELRRCPGPAVATVDRTTSLAYLRICVLQGTCVRPRPPCTGSIRTSAATWLTQHARASGPKREQKDDPHDHKGKDPTAAHQPPRQHPPDQHVGKGSRRRQACASVAQHVCASARVYAKAGHAGKPGAHGPHRLQATL